MMLELARLTGVIAISVPSSTEELSAGIQEAMIRDQHRLRQRLRQIRKLEREGRSTEKQRADFESRLATSVQRRRQRDENVPKLGFDDIDLPVMNHRAAIQSALREHQVIVVAGETGSGKSTQLPKICLEAGFGVGGLIAHTQPRRIAARSIATRIADELGSPLGKAVGYKVRFDEKLTDDTYIKLMTDGMLLAEAATDRFLEQYEVIILDEAHERSLNVDFLIGLLKRLLQKRRELRLIITSATIDAERFAEHFANEDEPAPAIHIEGRTYPVDVRYRPLEDEDGQMVDVHSGIVAAVHELAHDGGDMLVFLPTERDIREAAKRLRADKNITDQRDIDILPLYARLSSAEQNKIFRPGNSRRIVLATNVAESSLTVPRIHSVIDTGTARISRYSPRLRMQRLPIEAVSQASADQRKGRCGRLGPGTCIRLFSEQDFAERAPYTTPEIRRTNLAAVILQAKYLQLGELDQIPFLDPPRPETIREGYRTLFEIGAVDDHRRLTPLGKKLAQLPVDPRIARMVLAGDEFGCLAEVLIIAAALEVQDPRLRPIEQQQAADESHARFLDESSDFLSYLRLWDHVERQRSDLSRNKFQKACHQQFLSVSRLREWHEIHRQLKQTAIEHGLRPQRRGDDPTAIHNALLTGLLSCIAYNSSEHEYTGAGGTKLRLWPGSGLFRAKPKWVVAAELVETNKRYGRTVAKINPDVLEQLAPHLLKRTYSDPHWHEKSMSVKAFERVTLFGLPIVARRRVGYGPIDPELSRQLFIEHGLVEQKMKADDKFFRHNCAVLEEAERLAAKTRQRDYILDEYRVHEFYQQRVPDDIHDMAGLRQALKRDAKLRASLQMSLEDLIPDDAQRDPDEFPSELRLGSMQLPISYHFEPGSEEDGVTVTLPAAALSQVHQAQTDWLVPGLVEEKLVALIRSLPKPIRRGLVPAPDTAKKVASQLGFGVGSFLDEVSKRFSDIAQERITPRDFRPEKLPPHLRMRFRVVDEEGNEEFVGRDLDEIRGEQGVVSTPASSGIVEQDGEWNRAGLTAWDFDELPADTPIFRGGIEVTLFPALKDETTSVRLCLMDNQQRATTVTRKGICRLYQLANHRALREQVRWLPEWKNMVLWAATLCTQEQLESQLELVLADLSFLGRKKLPRTREEFEQRQSEHDGRIAVGTQELARVAPILMEEFHRARLSIEEIGQSRFGYARDDVQTQLEHLLPESFSDIPWMWFQHVPRYLKGISYRIDKLHHGGQARDKATLTAFLPYWRRYMETLNAPPPSLDRAALDEYRWMLEEYRVSIFAQPIGTAMKISPQRLDKQWHKVVR